MEKQIPPPWSVTELNEAVRDLLENTFLPVRVAGEISGLTIHRSGHVYLTLKDEHSQIRAVFFSGAENAGNWDCRTAVRSRRRERSHFTRRAENAS